MALRPAERPLELQLPENLDAEKFVLGTILIQGTPAFLEASRLLSEADFSLDRHRRIWRAFDRLQADPDGMKIDRVTVAEYLQSTREYEAVGGMSYLVTLDDGMPQLANFDSYCEIVREKSMLRGIIHLSLDAQDQAAFATDHKATEIAQRAAMQFLALARQERTPGSGLVTIGEYVNADEDKGDGSPTNLDRLLDPSKHGAGLRTGLLKLDEMTGGLRESELIILAARPAQGKSALAFGVGQHVASRSADPRAVAIFTLEMSKEQVMQRMVCAEARIQLQKLRNGHLTPYERTAARKALIHLAQAPLYIDDTAGTNLADITVKVKHLQAKSPVPLGLVILDYLQLMQGRGRFENRVQEISSLSRGFKLLAKELRVPFLVLSQLSRAPETRPGDHRPILSDLRESGSIEQDADMVAFIFREEVYHPEKESLKGEAELILAKQRNGPTGRVKLAFIHQYTKFENRAVDAEPDGFVHSTAGDRPAGLEKRVVELPKQASMAPSWVDQPELPPFDPDDRRSADDF